MGREKFDEALLNFCNKQRPRTLWKQTFRYQHGTFNVSWPSAETRNNERLTAMMKKAVHSPTIDETVINTATRWSYRFQLLRTVRKEYNNTLTGAFPSGACANARLLCSAFSGGVYTSGSSPTGNNFLMHHGCSSVEQATADFLPPRPCRRLLRPTRPATPHANLSRRPFRSPPPPPPPYPRPHHYHHHLQRQKHCVLLPATLPTVGVETDPCHQPRQRHRQR